MILNTSPFYVMSLTCSLLFTASTTSSVDVNNELLDHSPRISTKNALPFYAEWPTITSAIPKQDYIEQRVKEIVSKMTLGEKIGQMIMPEYRQVTPQEAKQYKIGSVLNGGGGWPGQNKYATAQEWASQADDYWLALDEAYAGRGFRIPFMWATDAVHGHNNVYSATLFPHNIGLGAANNPQLIKRIGEITAKEVVATGLDLTFAPTVAVPRDYRWGRVYEGYSESPEITYHYGKAIIEGLQGGESQLRSEQKVIATVKHWLGDGGTENGVDRGINRYSEQDLINIHALGYFSAIEAGAQVVMTSFNSWNEPQAVRSDNQTPLNNIDTNSLNKQGKLHGSRYLISEVLKDKIGFDGIVVTDWNGHGEIKGCTNSNCSKAVNAGNDLFMVTANNDWKGFYRNVIKQVQSGEISMARINDAVTRILRVKMRAGLWEKPRPSYRQYSGNQTILGAEQHRDVARQAVRESLVLLKNSQSILPLPVNDQSYLVVGSGADDLQKQTGGWSLTWQGNENKRSDYPNSETVLEAVTELVGVKSVFTDVEQAPMDAIAIVVIGEDPYAEMFGDIKAQQTLSYSELKASYRADSQLIKRLKNQGYQVVTVLFSGRPLYINPELNLSDAFVAAWLPGTEGAGITDVLFAVNGSDFTGKLSFSWPANKCMTSLNRIEPHIPNYQVPDMEQNPEETAALFAYGYGLDYQTSGESVSLQEYALDDRTWGCGQTEQKATPDTTLDVFGRNATDQFVPKISGQVTQWKGQLVSRSNVLNVGNATTTPINYKHQQDALSVSLGDQLPMQFYLQTPDKKGVDLRHYLAAEAMLQFDIRVKGAVPKSLKLAAHCVYPCGTIAPIQETVQQAIMKAGDGWASIRIPLQCLAENGLDMSNLNTPFLLYSDEAFEFDVGEIKLTPNTGGDLKSNVSCDLFKSY